MKSSECFLNLRVTCENKSDSIFIQLILILDIKIAICKFVMIVNIIWIAQELT